MNAIDVKRGVTTTAERVFAASGFEFGKLEVLWSGSTAGIIFERTAYKCDAKIVFPAINELSNIPQEVFNNLIGYALHELGHAWYTDNRPWDKARLEHGAFVGSLINGLEDPRIERLVIDSGNAPNARVLFENLLNSILKRDGYVEPDDKRNIPFLLAVEGRRLNGYNICVPSIINASPWAKHLKWALKRAQVAKDTRTIAKIAIELFERIKEQERTKPEPKETPEPQREPEKNQEPTEGTGGDGGEGEGDPSDNPQERPTDDSGKPEQGNDGDANDDSGDGSGDSDGDGDSGDGSDGGKPDGSDGSDADGDGKGGADGEPSDKPQEGGGYSNEDFEGGREVEPSDFIESELDTHAKADTSLKARPSVGKPHFAKFDFV